MAKRMNKLAALINRKGGNNAGPWGIQIGHPCGFIATSRHLQSRPALSKAVGDFLLEDASMSGDFEDMMAMMQVYRLKLSKKVKLHLKQWMKLGCPTWKENQGLSNGLVWLYTKIDREYASYHFFRDTSAELWAASNSELGELPIDCDGEPVINFRADGSLVTE
jgi:hypothetical protein